MVITLGKLRIIGEKSRILNVPANPTWNNKYSVADVLVGSKYIYVLHMNFNYVSQYNKNPDGSIGSLIRTNSWYDQDSYLTYLSANNSSVPYGYAMYSKNGEDYIVGWSGSHNALFRWRINQSNNRPLERTQYNVAPRTMAAYSRGGWDGGRYVYFYNRSDRGIYRWDIDLPNNALVRLVTISNDMGLTSSWTGSGMLVDTYRDEVYWGSGGDTGNGYLGGWSLSTGLPLTGTPRNPIRAADLTGIGVSLLNGEAGNISLTAAHRNIAYYFFSYDNRIVQLNIGALKRGPDEINAVTENIVFISGEEATVSWNEAEVYEDILTDVEILYRVEMKLGSQWVTIASDLTERSFTHTLPAITDASIGVQYRVSARTNETSRDYEIHDMYTSPTYTLYRSIFLVKAQEKIYTFKDDNWMEVTDTVDDFLKKGLHNLNHIPSGKWEELGDKVSLITYSNVNKRPIVDVTTPGVRPIYLLQEKLGNPDFEVVSYVNSRSPLSLKRTAVPNRQLIFPTGDIKLQSPTIPEAVVKMNLIASEGAGTTMRVMFSADKGETYVSWDGSQWNYYTDIANNEATEDLLEAHGMTIATLNGLTEEQLGEVFGYEPEHRTVRFVYLYDMNRVSDVLQSGELQISMDMHGSWRQAKEQDYTYGYPTNTELHVQLFTSGSYKINGLLYGDEIANQEGV